jgi:phosphonate transport system permease protein
MPGSATLRTSLLFVAVACLCLPLADLSISAINPGREMARLAAGLITPDFSSLFSLGLTLLRTLAFALCGVAIAALAGFILAQWFHRRLIRMGCAFVRAIHELFWALIFLQFFGLNPLTGVLAIAIPYAGIFAKVYAEILEEGDTRAAQSLASGTDTLSRFWYAQLPDAWVHLKSYTAYRLECGLRSSAVLGFVGLPTLGFHLESAFSEGQYSQVGALLLCFYVLIASLRLWARPRLMPILLPAAPFLLGSGLPVIWDNVTRFFTRDIVPYPLRADSADVNVLQWLGDIGVSQVLPGLWNTVVLTQIALVATGILTLLCFPLISTHFTGPARRLLGHLMLVIGRSTPEYMLAYMLLQLWGPSMLPAIVALAVHNACIIGHLLGRQSNEIVLRADAPRGLDRYAWELLPRLYPAFLAFLFYRWEIIMRETAILGILGIFTLGFFVDSAIQNLYFDQALILILVTAVLNIGIDSLSRRIRTRLRLTTRPTCEP